jgi:hypothetical protein
LYFATTGESMVDPPGHVQFLSQAEQSGHGAGGNRRDSYRDFSELLVTAENLVDPTEMSEHPNGGFALSAEGFDDPIVLNAVRAVGLQRCHYLRIYHTRTHRVLHDFQCHAKAFSTSYFRIYGSGRDKPFAVNVLRRLRVCFAGKSR